MGERVEISTRQADTDRTDILIKIFAPFRTGDRHDIEALMQHEAVLAYRYQGRRFDCGSKLGYLQASVEIGLQHAETGAAFADWLGQRG